MPAMKLAGLFALTMVAFLAVDAVWLTTATPRLYRPALASLRDWPIHITLIDLAWGTALTTATAFAGYHAALWLKITG
ncbi:MAG: DUF2177 family protein [Actinomycetota bacterium]